MFADNWKRTLFNPLSKMPGLDLVLFRLKKLNNNRLTRDYVDRLLLPVSEPSCEWRKTAFLDLLSFRKQKERDPAV